MDSVNQENLNIVFWQDIPSHIQAPALRELANCWPGSVHAVFSRPLRVDRIELGWQEPDLGRVKKTHLENGNQQQMVEKFVQEFRNDIHVFSGMGAYRSVELAFQKAIDCGASKLALLVEPGIQMGWQGAVRPLRSWWIARRYRNNIKLVLAMGSAGREYYRKSGFSKEAIFEFGYQTELHQKQSSPRVESHCKLIYVGKFIKRKGIDVLLCALARVRQSNWTLTIVGDGPEREALESDHRFNAISSKIKWLGAQPSHTIPEIISKHDLCIIPSRFEGWGVVTNEAIGAGAGVICSSRVTSRDLVQASGAGEVFNSGNERHLAEKIDWFLSDLSRVEKAKKSARAMKSGLSPENFGRYLANIFSFRFQGIGDRPKVPWLALDQPPNQKNLNSSQ